MKYRIKARMTWLAEWEVEADSLAGAVQQGDEGAPAVRMVEPNLDWQLLSVTQEDSGV